MNEIYKGKIIKTAKTFIILVVAFLGVTFMGYVIETQFFSSSAYTYLDYLLYLLGYGSIDDSNIWFKIAFSVGSLLVLTLFSSACTVTWLESRRTLKLKDSIVIHKNEDGDFVANLCLKSRAQSIYDAEVKLIINVGRESFSEVQNIAYIPRKNYRLACFDVKLNSVVYKHFKEVLENRYKGTELIVSVKYSDVLSGQEYTIFKKYSYAELGKKENDFVFANVDNYDAKNLVDDIELKNEFKSFILSKKLDVNMQKAQIIDSTSPERLALNVSKIFDVEFDKSKSYNGGDFKMLCIPIDLDDDWGVYYDMDANLKIELEAINDIDVFVEIKKDDGRTLMLQENTKLSMENTVLDINLKSYRRNTWENMKEICFTVFYSNIRDENKKAQFTIKECAFEI